MATLRIAFHSFAPMEMRYKALSEIKKIDGMLVTDQSYISSREGFNASSRYGAGPSEFTHIGCQYTNKNNDVDAIARKILMMPGVSRVT